MITASSLRLRAVRLEPMAWYLKFSEIAAWFRRTWLQQVDLQQDLFVQAPCQAVCRQRVFQSSLRNAGGPAREQSEQPIEGA